MKALGCCVALGLGLSASACGMHNGTASAKTNQNNEVVADYPVETAMLNVYTRVYSDQLYTLVDEQLVVINTEVTPKGATIFNNKQVQGAEMVSITTVNDQVVDKSVGINYFTLEPLVFHGFIDISDCSGIIKLDSC